MDSGLMDLDENISIDISIDVDLLIENVKKAIPKNYHNAIDNLHTDFCSKYGFQKRKLLQMNSQECEVIMPDIKMNTLADIIIPKKLERRIDKKLSQHDLLEG